MAILLPRLASPQFGLFDDGRTLVTARQMMEGDWSMSFDRGAGRFRPIYWAYQTSLAWLGGESPLVFFLGNLVLFVTAVFLLFALVHKHTGSSMAAGLAALFLTLSGPAIENYYTLSKSEPLQLVLLLSALLCFAPLGQGLRFSQQVSRTLGASFLFLLALLTKETSLVILPITAGWLALALLPKLARRPAPCAVQAAAVFMAALLAGMLFFGGRALFTSGAVTSGTYSNDYVLTPVALTASAVRWAGWILRDFPHLLLLIPGGLALLAIRRMTYRREYLWASLIWMAGCVAVYLPWVYLYEYYLLPFAAGAAVCAAVMIVNLLDLCKREWTNFHRGYRLGFGLVMVATALLLLTTLANNYTTARIQLTIDQANEDMLTSVASLPPGKDILLNIRYPNEYTDQIELQLGARFGRQKLDYATYLGGALPSGAFSLSPQVDNQPRMSVRMGVNEPTQEVWVQSLHDQLMVQGASPIYAGSRSFRMLAFDFPRLFCPLATNLTFCSQPGPLVDRRVFQYGWEIQQIPVSAL